MVTLPRPNNTPLRGGPVLRWGILAPGEIAAFWVRSVLTNTDQVVVAAASRSIERAQAFADTHGLARAYGSYEQLVADPDIDIVYIAAPHSEHRALALLAIAAGKHVLVEKPIALNAREACEIAEAARTAGVFAMEAMWSRFLPQTSIVAQLLADQALGEVLTVTADFGAVFDFDPLHRAFNPALGGGALLDIGVYPAWFAHFVLGAPQRVTATGTLASTGVDDQAALILDYASGAQAALTTSMRVATPLAAVASGTIARIELPTQFMGPSGLRFIVDGGESVEWQDATGFHWRDGLCYQTTAVARHIADGLTESPLHTLDDTIAVLEVLDAARAQVGAV
jgi:predicted dehydrogenase